MNGDVKRSYEYAIGCFKATSRQPLSAEQWQRLKSANRTGAEKLLAEFGFPAVNEECSAADSIEKDMAATVAFIRENAPDGELAFITEPIAERKLLAALETIPAAVQSMIRVTDY